MGFSLNMLTLFGLVLAIGVVVDDAIVVVEATASSHIERGLGAKAAAIKAMSEVAGTGGGHDPGAPRGVRARRLPTRGSRGRCTGSSP